MYIINKIQTAIDYIEAHLKEDMSKDLISDLIGISGPDIENAFKVLTGYTLAEYIRNRRLSEAALDIKNSSRSMLDISLDYRYNSTASFARAFSRFHGHYCIPGKKRGRYKIISASKGKSCISRWGTSGIQDCDHVSFQAYRI